MNHMYTILYGGTIGRCKRLKVALGSFDEFQGRPLQFDRLTAGRKGRVGHLSTDERDFDEMLYSSDNAVFDNQLRRPRTALRRAGGDRMHGILSQAVMKNVGKLRAVGGCAATESGHCARIKWDLFQCDKMPTRVSRRKHGTLAHQRTTACANASDKIPGSPGVSHRGK